MNKRLIVVAAAGIAAASQAQITGSLADFGVDLGGYAFSGPIGGTYAALEPAGSGVGHSDLSEASGVTAGGMSWTVWDGYGYHGNSTFAGTFHDLRNFGGQQCAAKAMYVKSDANYLYMGVVTGTNPNGVVDPYGRNRTYFGGDFAINPDFGHQTAAYGIVMPHSPAGSGGSALLVKGGTWYSPDADVGWAGPSLSTYKTGGISKGMIADFKTAALTYDGHNVVYADPTTGHDKQMYLYEARVNLSDLGVTTGDAVNVSWAVTCNNDFIQSRHVVVPEPSTIAGIGSSLIGLAGLRLRRRRA
jgi:hypothetical protein